MMISENIAKYRKQRGLTQEQLGELVGVSNQSVSKWETGKGFPDIKLLEPLAQALDVSLVELIRGERQQSDHLTVEEAEQVVSQAVDQSQKITARRYLRLLKWLLIAVFAAAAYYPTITLIALAVVLYWSHAPGSIGIIGGADGPTSILISTISTPFPPGFWPVALGAVAVLCLILAIRVWKLEKKLT